MPVAPRVTYPGVYIQEVPSDVRTIVGVDTATTAFIGRARRGPINKPVVCNSFGDFERVFGGLWLKSNLGYAVSDFFLNGGGKAVVVRLYHAAQPDTGSQGQPANSSAKGQSDAAPQGPVGGAQGKSGGKSQGQDAAAGQDQGANTPPDQGGNPPQPPADTAPQPQGNQQGNGAKGDGVATLDVGDPKQPDSVLKLRAASPGGWGNDLAARVTYVDYKEKDGKPLPSAVRKQLAQQYEVQEDDLFDLTVRDMKTGTAEIFPNVTVVDGPRRVDQVLANESQMVIVADGALTQRPAGLPSKRPVRNTDPAPGVEVWKDPQYYYKVQPATQDLDGADLDASDFLGDQALKTGIYALEHADIFNLICIPSYKNDGSVDTNVLQTTLAYCEKRRAMLLVDPPVDWDTKEKAIAGFPIPELAPSPNAAIFFPRIRKRNPLRDNQVETFPPSPTIAGILARTDAQRGVWKAPAGLDATLRGVVDLSLPLTDAENGELNPLGINCLRQMPAAGYVVWGARTMVGDDRLANQWKYLPVRRMALYIEESLYRGIQWAVFEPNDEPLWSQLRLNINSFMNGLFRQGAFQGQTPRDAYFVRCDSTTTTQADIDQGIVNIVVGFAPLKPAEFVVLYIQQITGMSAA